MVRLPKSALAVFAGLVVVFASACSSSAGTPAAGVTTAPGATTAAGASTGPAVSVAPTVNANDPNSIISQAISSGTTITSFHIQIAVSGTIKAAALASEAGTTGVPLTGDVKLDGTAIEGDVDVANQAAHLSLNVPAMQMLGNVPLTGDLILTNNTLYYKVSLLGPLYTSMDLGSLGSSLGALSSALPVPSAAASPMTDVTDELAQLQAQMQAAGVTATLVGVDQIGGKDANHISVTIPVAMINSEIAAESSGAPSATLDSASLDVWIYKDNYQLAKVELKGASSAFGNLDLTVTVTNYNQPVTITAPPASEVQAAP